MFVTAVLRVRFGLFCGECGSNNSRQQSFPTHIPSDCHRQPGYLVYYSELQIGRGTLPYFVL